MRYIGSSFSQLAKTSATTRMPVLVAETLVCRASTKPKKENSFKCQAKAFQRIVT